MLLVIAVAAQSQFAYEYSNPNFGKPSSYSVYPLLASAYRPSLPISNYFKYLSTKNGKSQTNFNDPRDNLVDSHAFKTTEQKRVEVSSISGSNEVRALLDKLILGPIVPRDPFVAQSDSRNSTPRLGRRKNQLHGRRIKHVQSAASEPK